MMFSLTKLKRPHSWDITETASGGDNPTAGNLALFANSADNSLWTRDSGGTELKLGVIYDQSLNTIDDVLFNKIETSTQLDITETASGGVNPTAGNLALFANSADNSLWTRDSGGTELKLGVIYDQSLNTTDDVLFNKIETSTQMDITETAPGGPDPSVGNLALFANSADNSLWTRDSGGTELKLGVIYDQSLNSTDDVLFNKIETSTQLDITETASGGDNPTAGNLALFANSADNSLWTRTSGGVETKLGVSNYDQSLNTTDDVLFNKIETSTQLDITETASGGPNPSAGNMALFANSADNSLWTRDSGGTELKLGVSYDQALNTTDSVQFVNIDATGDLDVIGDYYTNGQVGEIVKTNATNNFMVNGESNSPTGADNTILGHQAFQLIDTGDRNTGIGANAGFTMTEASSRNTCIGTNTYPSVNLTGTHRIMLGFGAQAEVDYSCVIGGTGSASINSIQAGDIDCSLGSATVPFGKIFSLVQSTNIVIGGSNVGGSLILGAANNIIVGVGATGFSLTDQDSNVLIGRDVGVELENGASVYIGQEAGRYLNGTSNTCTGVGSGSGATGISTGSHNSFYGRQSGGGIIAGSRNVCSGYQSGDLIASGNNNTCVGTFTNVTAAANNQTALGYEAVCDAENQITMGNGSVTEIRPMSNELCTLGTSSNKFGRIYASDNGSVIVGGSGISNATPGGSSVLIGSGTTGSAFTSNNSIFIGHNVGEEVVTQSVVYVGFSAGRFLNAANNTCVGVNSGIGVSGVSTGSGNSFFGRDSGISITTGDNNSSVGFDAGDSVTTGNGNTCLGASSDCGAALNNSTAVGFGAISTVSNEVVLGNASVAHVRTMANCDLGTSSNPFKDVRISGDIIQDGNTTILAQLPGNNCYISNGVQQSPSGTNNTLIGIDAGALINTGDRNLCVGFDAGAAMLAGSQRNVMIGVSAGTNSATALYRISLGWATTNEINHSMMIGANDPDRNIRSVYAGTDSTCDLGRTDKQFKDAHLSGEVNCGNITTTETNVHIGLNAGLTNQGTFAIAIGDDAGATNQGTQSICIGPSSGMNCNAGTINIGFAANQDLKDTGTGINSISIGKQAAQNGCGNSSICIGSLAGNNTCHDNSIILNATGIDLDTSDSYRCYVAPIRDGSANLDNTYPLRYNTVTKEVVSGVTVQAGQLDTVTGTSLSITGTETVEWLNAPAGVNPTGWQTGASPYTTLTVPEGVYFISAQVGVVSSGVIITMDIYDGTSGFLGSGTNTPSGTNVILSTSGIMNITTSTILRVRVSSTSAILSSGSFSIFRIQ